MKKNKINWKKDFSTLMEKNYIDITYWFISFLLYYRKAPLAFLAEIEKINQTWEEKEKINKWDGKI